LTQAVFFSLPNIIFGKTHPAIGMDVETCRLRAGELIELRSERGLSRLIKYARYDLLIPEEKKYYQLNG
jgi:hypothetical protein